MRRRKKTVKVPQVMQMEAMECGAACLAMILAYYGRFVPLEQLRVECGISRDGAKTGNILRAARRYGLNAKGMAYSAKALSANVKPPCILFWNFTHYVVFAGKKGRHYCINDPARGQIKVSEEEFETSFTGIALVFEKTDAFQKAGSKTSPSRSIMRYLSGMKLAVLFVMIAATIASLANIATTSLSRVFFDEVLSGVIPQWLEPLLLIMLFLTLLWGCVSFLKTAFMIRIQGKSAVVNSSRFMRHLLNLPAVFYSQRSIGDLQQRQDSNEKIVSDIIGQIAPVLINVFTLIFYALIMLRYSVPLALIGMSAVVMNAWLAHAISVRRVNIARSNAINNGKFYAATVSGIDMIETLKAAGAERGFFARWAGLQAGVEEDNVRMSEVSVRLGVIPSVITQLVNIIVFVLGVLLIIENKFTTGSLLAFIGFLSSFMQPVSALISLGQTIQETETQIERIDDVLKYPADVPEKEASPCGEVLKPLKERHQGSVSFADTSCPMPGAGSPDQRSGSEKEENEADREDREYSRLTGEVELKDISFGYSPLEEPLIEHFDLHIRPGQWVALAGSSGGGKSTLSRLIAGLYKPWSGEILFDGQPASGIPREIITASLAMVDQDIVVFEDSVADNIRLWNRTIGDDEVTLACRDAGIHQTIAARSGGYSCRVLSGGRNFSGGELQRMEIARALAQEPSILILDEATSALDSEAEADVMKHIRDLGITCIVVAHRLSTIRDCDEIIVLENGKVAERGTHEELIAGNGAYAALVRS